MRVDKHGRSKSGGRFWTGIAILVFVLIVGFGWVVASNYKHFGNLLKVIVFVKTQYLNATDYDRMVEGAIKGLIQSLDDPYSAYLDPVTYKKLRDQVKGSFGGLGILVSKKEDSITVVRTYRGTPAHRDGILPGDIIQKIDDRDARGIDLESAVQLMRGPVGTKVRLTLTRAGNPQPFDVELTREEIRVPTVEGKMLKNGVVHLGIAHFTEKTPEEVGEMVEKFKKEGMKGIILDLRNNPGGELMSAVKVAGYFVPPGPVVFIEYRGGRIEEHKAKGDYLGIPLVVLVNEGSASASEILAGAVKDTGAGVLVGQKTFGKGVVQMIFELDNGAGLKLTTARYLTPKKTDINKAGIVPDVVVDQPPGDIDVQLQRAIEVIERGGKK